MLHRRSIGLREFEDIIEKFSVEPEDHQTCLRQGWQAEVFCNVLKQESDQVTDESWQAL